VSLVVKIFKPTTTPNLDSAASSAYPELEREGRLQSAERAVPTLIHNFEGREPSFSLIECGLQAH